MRVGQPITWNEGKEKGIVVKVLPEKQGVFAVTPENPKKAIFVRNPSKITDKTGVDAVVSAFGGWEVKLPLKKAEIDALKAPVSPAFKPKTWNEQLTEADAYIGHALGVAVTSEIPEPQQ